jgi:hypothetical protein
LFIVIRYSPHTEINRQKWDECITRSALNLPYAYTWYLDAVCPGWHALIMDDYRAVMPLTWNRKYMIPYLYQPYFTQQLGIFSDLAPNDEQVHEFLLSVPGFFRFAHVNLNESNRWTSAGHLHGKELRHWTSTPNTNLKLSLNSSYASLCNTYTESHRKNIRRALNSGLHFSNDFSNAELVGMMKNMLDKKGVKLSDRIYQLLHAILEQSAQHLRTERIGVTGRNHPGLFAAAFFLFNKKGITYFSANTPESKTNKAMFFLLDSFIRDHSGSDQTLDFSGSNIAGIAEFFAGFGARPVVYSTLHLNRLPFPLRLIKK